MALQFSKMHGLGNDMVVIDATEKLPPLNHDQIRLMADRHIGIGADQIIVIAPPPQHNPYHADFTYRIFNPDGSEVGQCGNGARTAAKFIFQHGLIKSRSVRMQTKIPKADGTPNLLTATLEDDGQISVEMGIPLFEPQHIPMYASKAAPRYKVILSNGEIVEFGALSLGNPHAVIQVADLSRARVEEIGRALRYNKTKFPEGVNVGFMQVLAPNHIKLRVYERGSGETLACGSGACAATIIGNIWGILQPMVTVDFTLGSLTINWQGMDQSILMTGPAVEVFKGEMEFK